MNRARLTRTREDFHNLVTDTVRFSVWTALWSLGALVTTSYLTWGHSRSAQVVIGAAAFIAGFALAFLLPLAWLWLRAPLGLAAAELAAQRARITSLEEELARATQRIADYEDRFKIVVPQFGTELRDIRHKIEIVRSTRPHPHYSDGFQLPNARWDEYDEILAASPDIYRVVERAYTAAHHVNSALDMRRTRANAGQTIGVIPEDGLDAAYDAAGDALDALDEPRGEPLA